MGKNRKPGNVVQSQIKDALGTGNKSNQGILKEDVSSGTLSDSMSKNVCGKSISSDKCQSESTLNPGNQLLTTEENTAIFSCNNLEIVADLSKPFQSLNQDNHFIQAACNQIYDLKDNSKNSEKLPHSPTIINSLKDILPTENKKCLSDVKFLDHGLSGGAECFCQMENIFCQSVNLAENKLVELEIDNKTEFSIHSHNSVHTSNPCLNESDQINFVPNIVAHDLSEGVSKERLKSKLENINLSISSSDEVKEESNSSGKYQHEFQNVAASNKSKSQKKKEKKAKANKKKLSEQKVSDLNDKETPCSEGETKFSCCDEDKKKLKNIKDADKKEKKKPSKKQLAMIHEALKKAKEEEERQRKEEEARQKKAEEAERMRLEKLRAEQEKKEMKKLKEKKRKEKAKAEGRLLSKSQKQARARMEATLAVLRQQGIEVPQICDKKATGTNGPRLGNSKCFQRKRVDSARSNNSCDSAIVISERHKFESFSSQESKDSLSDFPSSLDLTEDSSLTPESDKGIYSFSEESDDNFISSKNDRKGSVSNSSEIFTLKASNTECESASGKERLASENAIKLRSPVVCVLGHVDTGKTKILDHIRKTHVQDCEAGGITQQIGATMIPNYALKEKCKMVKNFSSYELKIPGLLVIDTPGHESFSNLRSRGSSICDIAILVVDIMHGLEPQTIESINLLKKGKTPFIVALNKVDRLYDWKSSKDEDIETTIKNQSLTTQAEFTKRYQRIILEFANECLNAALFYENNEPRSFVSMVPTSAITGDGMGNILSLIAQLTQSIMPKQLVFSEQLQATVLEVKAIPGLGTTIDVILINGRLQEGDTIILAGQEGPIVTQIRSLLMPQPLKELRVKNPYIEHKIVEGAQGVKIIGRDLDKSIAGLPLFVAQNPAMIDSLKNRLNCLFHDAMNSIKTSERGVYVQASTLGSLEALLEFLFSSGVPYFNVKIGPVVKKDVMKASIMLEHDVAFAAILAFDVKVERDAQELADHLGVQIFQADIIYHLLDMYDKYREDLSLKRKQLAVFPCKLRIDPDSIVSIKDPLVLGVHVEAGTLREETPLCVVHKDAVDIGIVSSIEVNNNKVSCAKKGDEVRITINTKPGDSPKTYGKHFIHEDFLISHISRQSIDVCKELFRHELQSSDWHLMVELKKLLHIM